MATAKAGGDPGDVALKMQRAFGAAGNSDLEKVVKQPSTRAATNRWPRFLTLPQLH